MSRRLIRCTLLALALVLLAGCASQGGRLQQAGDATLFDMALETQLDWARIRGNSRHEAWTIDGLPLNQLQVFSRVRANEHVFLGPRARKGRPDGPWFRPGMRPDEVRDIILDGLRLSQWANVSASDLRPARFGGVDGLRFELEMTNQQGLRYRGMAAAAERDQRLTVLVWVAPQEHYYGRDAAAVSAMFDSLRFVK